MENIIQNVMENCGKINFDKIGKEILVKPELNTNQSVCLFKKSDNFFHGFLVGGRNIIRFVL